MTATRTQLRGHCQRCTRQHAVVDGRIAKHGYRVEYSEFVGTCQGADHAPIETNTTLAQAFVGQLRASSEAARERAAEYRTGTATLFQVSTGRMIRDPQTRKLVPQVVPWADATTCQQERALEAAAARACYMAAAMAAEADAIEKACATYAGQPLVEVRVDKAKPAPISVGERRTLRGIPVECVRVEARRVYCKPVGRPEAPSNLLTLPAWRKLPLADQCE